jgi:urea transport system permease protein
MLLGARFWLLASMILVFWSPAVYAFESLQNDQLQQLSAAGSEESEHAIARIEAAEPSLALFVLGGFDEGRLGIDAQGTAWVVDKATARLAVDRRVGVPVGSVKFVVPDNQTRRFLNAALTRLRLTSSDVTERRAAATAVANHPSASELTLLKHLEHAEQDEKTRQKLVIAVAKLEIESADRSLRLAAAKAIEHSGDISMRETLSAILKNESDPELRKALSAAIAALDWQELKIRSLANLIYGLSLGSVLLLAALGLAITFGLMKVINMAHGEMLMLGAYATYLTQAFFKRFAPNHQGWYLPAAVPVAFVATALVGLLLERLVVRKLYGRPLETLLATWGLSLVLIQTVRTAFGAQNVTVATPEWLSGGWELMPTVVIPYSRVLVLGFTCLVVTFVWYVLQRTSLGLKLRAVTQNREMAAAIGIPTTRIDAWTFALGSGVAGLGGVALSQLGNVGPELGQQHIIDSFMVVVLGGVGNILGSIVGAVGLGVASKFLEPTAGAVLGKILILVVIILFIQWRPQGLFAPRGRAVEG